MEKKKVISIIFLTLTFLLITIQVSSISSICIGQTVAKDLKKDFGTNFIINQDSLSTNAIFENMTVTIEPVWFYINLIVVIITPIAIFVPILVISNKKQKANEAKAQDSGEKANILDVDNESAEEPKVLGQEKSYTNTGKTLARVGLLLFFVQNLLILLMYILFFVLIPTYTDPQTPISIIRAYLIILELDFVAGLLIAIGVILISLEAKKNKIFAYLAAGSWLVFIGLAIYPRIEMIIGFTGEFTDVESIATYFEQLGEYLMTFYGANVLLQTLGHCFLAISLFFSSKFLIDNTQFTAKGIVNSFGMMNYITGGLMNILLLLLLTFGIDMTEQALGSIGILYIIVLIIKLIAVPFVGLIAGIMGFKRMKPLTTTA